ncbi:MULTISPECIES: helix-turn-helix transcriptional regulator [Actinoplanes]|uniref:helix-turn-helix domain-containing protein n=1 Tax=Actinoplanes TaxID=1865 RepID=UPI0005F2D09B|nr:MULTISPECIES: helix-turn-helix transcriptional regulator [Actinoplanes]GLY00670.1 transcriptional regulator [Actinoplanes sp. NBRC 101535]
MNHQNDIRAFLTSRRARITPDRAGLPTYGGRRRVAGLRREEVALLAGVSVDYYNQIERGHLRGVSEQVLDAVSQALQLDDAEREHLHHLARATSSGPGDHPSRTVRPGVQRLLDTMTGSAVAVFTPWMQILATNDLGRALFTEAFDHSDQPNLARYAFLDPRARHFHQDWNAATDEAVTVLRSATGLFPDNTDLTSLITELVEHSADFRDRWARHDVRFHRTGTKVFHHAAVGELVLPYEALEITQDPGLTIVAYTAEAGSASDDRLRNLVP